MFGGDASLLGYGLLARGVFGRKGGWLDLVQRGLPEQWQRGPQLESVPYPQVMVARAETDGTSLDFILRGEGRVRVTLSRLEPRATYRVDGGLARTVVASIDGAADLEVDVADRAVVRVYP